ncbi:MAG: exodeoxyribonuclease VII small subunit [Candidatus Kerfeldbacteria bacterium]|nr:exodeoxyribonuclease VII small subunit [Candidatus Kerfeldbacteria bacterium]
MPKKSAKVVNDFQEQFSALEKITSDFEAGKYDLATGLKKFEEGLQLAQALKQHLTDVENNIAVIKGKYHELTPETDRST